MATILNSVILDSAILHKTLIHSYWIWLKVIHSASTWWWQPSWILPSCIQPIAQKNFTHAFSLKLMFAAILNSAILVSAILHKKNFTCSFWLNLMMAAILNSANLDSDTAILDSNTLLSSLRFTQKHSSSTLILTQLIPSDELNDGNHLEFFHLGLSHFT